jgi:hypothetical protein
MDIQEFARKGAKARWKGKTKKEKREHAMKMVAAREAKKKANEQQS